MEGGREGGREEERERVIMIILLINITHTLDSEKSLKESRE